METEKSKMITGKQYNAFDNELVADRKRARSLLFALNRLHPGKKHKRETIIKKLLGATGENLIIESPFMCDYGFNIHIGDNFFSNYNLTLLDCGPLHIGNNVMIGPNVGIYTVNHPFDPGLRNEGFEIAHKISIGNNVWIGGHVVINPGVTIGDNAVIGSGSVVTRDIPENVMAAGNPCRVIRQINSEK